MILPLFQFTAHGGQSGPEIHRVYRTTEAFELAQKCTASAQAGRHVLCMGDLNSLPSSLCMALLQSVGGLQDALAHVHNGDSGADVTCDSPKNTWSKNKKIDQYAQQHGGKCLDYVLYRGPANRTSRLSYSFHEVTFTDLIDSLQVSYSDHFGIEVVFSIVPPEDGKISGGSKKFESRSDVLHRALLPIRQALHNAHVSQKNHLGVFLCLFGFDLILVAALTCASAWLRFGQSVAPSIIVSVLVVATSWATTTALYSGVVWGEWHKRTYEISLGMSHCTHRLVTRIY